MQDHPDVVVERDHPRALVPEVLWDAVQCRVHRLGVEGVGRHVVDATLESVAGIVLELSSLARPAGAAFSPRGAPA